jgi:hypothetical protein
VNQLSKLAENEFENDKEYLEKHKAFFTTYDTNNCERNYQAIKNLT